MYSQEDYFNLISSKSNIDSKLIDIGLHSKGISEYLNYSNTSQWFHIAWSIKDLKYDGINYDASFMMCRPSYEYESAKQKLYKKLVSETTLFTNLYNGFESFINEIKLEECIHRKGKINAATKFISEKINENNFTIELYNDIVLLSVEMYNSIFDDHFSIIIKPNDCTNTFGLGIKLIYKIRNKLMHGDFFFPEPLDYGVKPPFHPELINLSSRLILISMQLLLIAKEKIENNQIGTLMNSTFLLKQKHPSSYCDEKDDCELDCEDCFYFSFNELSFLTNLHVKNADFNTLQLNIEFSK
jgi:hypothetical protein